MTAQPAMYVIESSQSIHDRVPLVPKACTQRMKCSVNPTNACKLWKQYLSFKPQYLCFRVGTDRLLTCYSSPLQSLGSFGELRNLIHAAYTITLLQSSFEESMGESAVSYKFMLGFKLQLMPELPLDGAQYCFK